MNQNALCWINQTIIPAHEATVSVFDHGLLYGDGVFEGIRFYHRKPFMLEAHLTRLNESAMAIALELPHSLAEIEAAIMALIERFDQDDGYLRLVVTRGVGNLGIDPRKCALAGLFIIADQLSVLHDDSDNAAISLHIAKTRRMPVQCLDPAIKSLNYLNNILARIEANQAGKDEALMLNVDGYVSEGSVDNIFIVKKGVLFTPQLNTGMLAGITRAVIIEIAKSINLPCEQTLLTVDDLADADECFLTGTGAELIRVGQIGDQLLGDAEDPLLPLISQRFREYIDVYCRAKVG